MSATLEYLSIVCPGTLAIVLVIVLVAVIRIARMGDTHEQH